MAFWSAEKLDQELGNGIVDPFDPARISHSSYEMGVGTEAFITSNPGTKTTIPNGEKLEIPPGQFGVVLTNEVVKIPNTAIGFISIRASVKFRGLINVSGFHVDPGFEGRLKFAVYNAGSKPIILERHERVFLLWLADLDQPTKRGRKGKEEGWDRITSKNVEAIQGDVASPAQLKKEIDALRAELATKVATVDTKQAIIITLAIAILFTTLGVLAKVYVDFYSDALRGRSPSTTSQPSSAP